jgi:hypothetical protein
MVIGHKQPARAPLVDVVPRVTRSETGQLTVKRLGVSPDDIRERRMLAKLSSEIGDTHHLGAFMWSHGLHDRVAR